MSLLIYNKTRKFVKQSFKNSKCVPKEFADLLVEHLERTVYWIKKLRPDADEALLVAAIAHDIERAYKRDPGFVKKGSKDLTGQKYLDHHQKESARVIAEFLEKQNIKKDFISRVKELVSRHEVGGDLDQNLLKDADSLSFFEGSSPYFVNKMIPRIGKEKMRKKFDMMFERISLPEVKELARPMYEKAIRNLGEDKRKITVK